MIYKLLIWLFILLTIPTYSYAWLRDADIAASRDSLRVGLYTDLSLAYEKIIDKDTSVGISYWPLPYGEENYFLKGITDLSYNKQFYRDDKTSWAFFYGFLEGEQFYRNYFVIPEAGISYGYKFNDRFRARINLVYCFDPYDMELAYLFSKNIELSFALSITNSMFGVTYLF